MLDRNDQPSDSDDLLDRWEDETLREDRPKMTVAGAVETVLKHPTFLIAAAAAIPILAIVWGVSRLSKKREPKDQP